MNIKLKAVTIGDINGIGIHLLIKLWKYKKKEIGNFILVTNYNLFIKFLKKNNINLPTVRFSKFNEITKVGNNNFLIYDIKAKNNYQNTYNSLLHAFHLTKKNKCTSLITLPLNKEKINKNIDKNFIGQTELLQKLDKKKISNMFFYSKKIIIVSLTTHIPISKVSDIFKNKNFIYNKIISINQTLKHDLNIANPTIAITGINPHAGENGVISNYEIKYLSPVIKKLQNNKIKIDGPLSADTLFSKSNRKKYNCFVCTYHDQALIPFKIINNFCGVNYTGSLNIIRTSPDHGTAYDLINDKKAKTDSLYASFKLAEKIYKNRLN